MNFIPGYIIILISAVTLLNAQSLTNFKAKVVNSETGVEIPGVKVLEQGTIGVTYSDQSGNFSVELTSFPSSLVLTHPKYKTRIIPILRKTPEIKMEPLNLKLHSGPGDENLRSFDRVSSRVLDFSFYDQLILILGSSGKEIRFIDHEGNLVDRKTLDYKMEGMAEDCLGSIYIYSSDTAYQVYYDYSDIRIVERIPIRDFREFIMPCQCYYKGGLIYTISRRRDLITSVQYANKGIVSTIKEFADSAALQILDENYGYRYFVDRNKTDSKKRGYLGHMSDEELSSLQDEAPLNWFDSFLIKPNRIYAFRVDGELHIYDLKDMKRFVYHDLSDAPEVTELSYEAKDTERMLRDEVTGQIYIVYERKGRTYLRSVDDGNYWIGIEEFAFPQKARMHNGNVYFINTPLQYGGNYLFRRN